MTLEQVAQQAMAYLDSVGVTADYDIEGVVVSIETDNYFFCANNYSLDNLMTKLEDVYPQKSPA